MTLEKMLQTFEGLKLYVGKEQAMQLWEHFHADYETRYGTVFYHACILHSTDDYVKRKTEAFNNFCHKAMENYDAKIAQEELHHRAQENKLKRLNHEDRFP